MKILTLERKRTNEMVRKEKFTFYYKADHFHSNGAKVCVIVEYNGKYFSYNSNLNEKWVPSELMLVREIPIITEILTNGEKKRYYPISERYILKDIRQKMNRIKEKARAKKILRVSNGVSE